MEEIVTYVCSICKKEFKSKTRCIYHENHKHKYTIGKYITILNGVYRVDDYDRELSLYELTNVNTANVRYHSEQTLNKAFKEATVLDYLRTLSAEELVRIEFDICSHHDFCVYAIIHSGKPCPSSSDCKEGKIKFLNQPLTDDLIKFFKTGTTKYEERLLEGENNE